MNKSTKSIMENLALVSQVGIMMVIPIAFGVFLGNLIDEKLGTTPIFLIVLIILGVGSAFRNLMHLATRQTKDYKNDYSPHTIAEKYAREGKEDKTSEDKNFEKSDRTQK